MRGTTVPVRTGWRARDRAARRAGVLGVAMLLGAVLVVASARRPDARLVAETSIGVWGAVLLLSLAAASAWTHRRGRVDVVRVGEGTAVPGGTLGLVALRWAVGAGVVPVGLALTAPGGGASLAVAAGAMAVLAISLLTPRMRPDPLRTCLVLTESGVVVRRADLPERTVRWDDVRPLHRSDTPLRDMLLEPGSPGPLDARLAADPAAAACVVELYRTRPDLRPELTDGRAIERVRAGRLPVTD